MKYVLITGAGSGIGKATALWFAQKGWFVGLWDIKPEPLQEVYNAIGRSAAIMQQVDITQADMVQRAMADFARSSGNRLDLLVNNAGVLEMGFFEQIELAAYRRMIDVNIWGMLCTTYYALPLLKQTPGAQIIGLSSAAAIYGVPEFVVYAATKHAVRAFTEGLSLELEHHGIRVSDIMPPFVDTPMLSQAHYRAWSVDKMGVRLKPEDVAAAIWKATHCHRQHHIMTLRLRLLNTLGNLMPFLRRPLMKRLTMPPKKNI